jgi:hypothetical protein
MDRHFQLLGYDSKLYDKLFVVFRSDAEPLAEFYNKQYKNVVSLYLPFEIAHMIPALENYIGIFDLPGDIECIGTGQYCVFRTDALSDRLYITEHFWLDFYRFFNMDPVCRLEDFKLTRDYVLEHAKFIKHVDPGWTQYRLYHDCKGAEIPRDSGLPYLELGKLTENLFFDCIKILENAHEIHVIDSVWAALTYLLDYKYRLFSHIKITVYAKRGWGDMFRFPLLPNWTVN